MTIGPQLGMGLVCSNKVDTAEYTEEENLSLMY